MFKRVRVKVFNANFNILGYIVAVTVSFIGGGNDEYAVIGIDCTGSCKSNYHTIMTMTPPPPLSHDISTHMQFQEPCLQMYNFSLYPTCAAVHLPFLNLL